MTANDDDDYDQESRETWTECSWLPNVSCTIVPTFFGNILVTEGVSNVKHETQAHDSAHFDHEKKIMMLMKVITCKPSLSAIPFANF